MKSIPISTLAIALAFGMAAPSCGDDTGQSMTPDTASSSTGAEAMTGDDSGTSAGGTDSGSSVPDLGVCAKYIECIMDVTPEAITTAIATYGEEGLCWQLPGVQEEDCWTECTALLETLREIFPDSAACRECNVDSDCGDAAFCEPPAYVCEPWECITDADCPPETPTCLPGWQECSDWECVTDKECPPETPICIPSNHTCFDGGTIACVGTSLCYWGSYEDTQELCPDDYVAGPCSTEGAVGYCVMTSWGWEVVYYDLSANGGAVSHCAGTGGTFVPA